MHILITGGAGYIGSWFAEKISANPLISKITVIDLLEKPKLLEHKKIFWIRRDLAEDGWQKEVLNRGPIDIVLHAAFKIRNPFGKTKKNEINNLAASKKVFGFCFENNVEKMIYLSSVAAYGAEKENIGKLIKESEPLKENKSPYGIHKKEVEKILSGLVAEKKPKTKTIVLRLASITGPYGQSLKTKFGLVTILKKFPFTVELNPFWARQFVHEDDLISLLEKLSFGENYETKNEVYNVATEQIITAEKIAKITGKKVLKLPAWAVKSALFFLWPISFGKLPPPSGINSLIYPINVDGSKIKSIGFNYCYSSGEALLARKK